MKVIRENGRTTATALPGNPPLRSLPPLTGDVVKRRALFTQATTPLHTASGGCQTEPQAPRRRPQAQGLGRYDSANTYPLLSWGLVCGVLSW